MGKYFKLKGSSLADHTVRTAAQTAMLMAVLTLCSKLLGFVREMIMANYFGTSYIVDAYVMSTALPGILFGGIFASVATAYMPLYSKVNEDQGEKAGNHFTSEVINLLIVVSAIASMIGIIFSDQLVSIFASGFTGETAQLTSFFVRITFSYTLLSSVASIIEFYLQYKGIFLSQIIAGFAQNVMLIIIIIISAYSSYYYLAFGLLLGTGCRMAYNLFVARKKNFTYTITFDLSKSVKNIALLAVPVFIGSSMQQISTFVDKTLASGLVEGSVSALNYAMLLVLMITGLTTGIFTTIIYPKLTLANSLEESDRFNSIVCTGMNLILMIAAPCTLGAILYRNQVVQIVYERGAFDTSATALTASAFAFYSIGLVSMAMNELLIKVYYSMHNMKWPMIFSGIGVIIDIVFNLILVRFMAHNGLALSTSIGFMVSTVLLAIGIKLKYPQIRVFESYQKTLKITVAAIAAVGISSLCYSFVILPFAHIIVARVIQLGLAVAIAAAAYLVLLKIFKIEEIKLLKQLVGK